MKLTIIGIVLGADELMPSLHSRLAQMGAECLIETISSLPECLKTARPQNNDNVSYGNKLLKRS